MKTLVHRRFTRLTATGFICGYAYMLSSQTKIADLGCNAAGKSAFIFPIAFFEAENRDAENRHRTVLQIDLLATVLQ